MGRKRRIQKKVKELWPEGTKKSRNGRMDGWTGRIIQYVMTASLLLAAFYLPRYGAECVSGGFSGGESAAEARTDTVRAEARSETDTEESGPQAESGAGQLSAGVGSGAGADADGTDAESGAGQLLAGAGSGSDADTGAPTRGVIVLDAGHGGDDPGMIGGSGIEEKTLNLIYAQKLEQLFTAAGYQVVQTRPTEEGLYEPGDSNKKARDMQKRVAIIAEAKPLITISIHQNSYPADSSVRGPQVFYYEHSAEGEKLASCIQESLNTELSVSRPRTHKGNTSYYILKRSKSVTVIVECGFLTNPEEEAKLQEEEYQDQVARAIFDGAAIYLGAA